MAKEVLTEAFLHKFVELITKSAITNKKPKALLLAIGKDPELARAFSDLQAVTKEIKRWAEKQREIDPDFARIDAELKKQMRSM